MSPTLAAVVLVALKVAVVTALVGGVRLGIAAWRDSTPRTRAAAAVLTALALQLRRAAPASPHDIYCRAEGALWSTWPDFDRGLAFPAVAQVLRPLFAPFGADDDRWLYTAVAALGALGPLLVVGLGARLGSTRVGWVAGALFVLASPHVRLSHTDAQQIPALTFLLLALVLAWDHAGAPSWRRALPAAAALAVAATMRLDLLVVPGVVVVYALVGPRLWARHAATWVAAALAAVLVAVHTWGVVALGTWDPLRYAGGPNAVGHVVWDMGWRHLVMWDPAYTAPPVALLGLLGMVRGPLTWPVRLATTASALGLSLALPTWSAAGGDAFALSKYQVVATPFALLLAANGLGALARRRPWLWWGGGLALVVASATRLPLALAPSTLSAEYAFVRDTLPTLPEDCLIVRERWVSDQGLDFPFWLLGPGQRQVDVALWDGKLDGCVLYYRSASCDIPWSEPLCSTFPRTHVLTPVAETTLPNRTWIYDHYAHERVPVGFYRVEPDDE